MSGLFDASQGSSPRMRGTRSHRLHDNCPRGIIPAYAGNTQRRTPCRPSHRDHPRVCGEHNGSDADAVMHRGSSPRMRGTHVSTYIEDVLFGIIPAYAGNTACSKPSPTSPRDHPRVCGEHPGVVSVTVIPGGSSPRMRGTPLQEPHRPRPAGIIPAYAGNTLRD